MFELLSPLYFYIGGTLGVVIPLVLHLIQRNRTVRMPFSTLRFLRLAQKKSSSRLKIEHLLLWLLRTLLLVVLSLAFAILMMRDKVLGTWFGRAARDVAIVIDGSYSMDYSLGRRTVWQESIDSAVAVVEGLTERDRFCIYVAGEHVTPLIEQLSANKEEAISRLKALKIGDGSSQLAPAIMDANAVLAEVKERRQREIFVITDTQALPWRGFGSKAAESAGKKAETAKRAEGTKAAPENGVAPSGETEGTNRVAAMGVWDPTKISEDTVCFAALMGASAPENASVVDVALDPPLIMKGFASRATLKVLCTGTPKNSAATLYVDEKEVGRQSISFETNRIGEATFVVPPLTAGRHAARLKLPDDNLMIDNMFYFIIKAEDQFPTLCVGGRDDTLFLRTALTAGLGMKGEVEADWVEPGKLAEKKLQSYACIFLCNAVSIGADEMTALERFIDAGGLVILFPGDAATVADYRAWTCLPGLPTAVEPVPLAERRQLLNWDAPNHVILKGLKTGETALTVTARKRLAWEGLEKGAERLISCGGEHPFLLGRARGRGYVLLFAVSADRTWSDFPLSPYYLPIVRQIVLFGAGVGSYAPYVWCTQSLPLEPYLPDATRETALSDPEGNAVPVRSITEEARTILRVEDLTKAGIYRQSGAPGAESGPVLAVNTRREESDLTPLDPADVKDLLGLKHVYVARDKEQMIAQIQESRVGRTFAEELLWLVLLLAAIEFFYANRLMKSVPSLSEKLAIEPSGNLRKDHPA